VPKTDLKILKDMNILYIEDDSMVALQTVALLRHFFDTVLYSSNAEDALEIYKSNNIHLLITDIELPGMSGLALCDIIRKEDKKTPIFITTMHDDKENLQKAVKLNLVDYLIKPISISAIKKTLTESLERLNENNVLTVRINKDTYYYPFRGEIEVSKKSVPLAQKEIELLDLLLKHKNQIVARETIEYTLHPDEPLSDSAYKNIIFRLRKKIGKDSITSTSGVGILLKIC
jgi:DNA-binding response OmpR family regulator